MNDSSQLTSNPSLVNSRQKKLINFVTFPCKPVVDVPIQILTSSSQSRNSKIKLKASYKKKSTFVKKGKTASCMMYSPNIDQLQRHSLRHRHEKNREVFNQSSQIYLKSYRL